MKANSPSSSVPSSGSSSGCLVLWDTLMDSLQAIFYLDMFNSRPPLASIHLRSNLNHREPPCWLRYPIIMNLVSSNKDMREECWFSLSRLTFGSKHCWSLMIKPTEKWTTWCFQAFLAGKSSEEDEETGELWHTWEFARGFILNKPIWSL